MAFIPLPSGIRVAVEYIQNGQVVVNVYHVTTAQPITTVNLTALAQILVDWWTTDMRQNFVQAIGLQRVTVTDVSVANGLQVINQQSPVIPGTIVGAAAPNNVAIVATQRTGFSGRSFRGRNYFAGVAAAEIADNFISSTYAGNVINDMNSLATRLSAGGFQLVVASYRANGAPRVTGVATPVSNFSMDLRVDTQRRRLPGTGE